jgi:hypothetical protein
MAHEACHQAIGTDASGVNNVEKRIVQFEAGKHLSVCLEDQPTSLFLDGDSGLIFLDEGNGPGRISGAVLAPERKPEFVASVLSSGDAQEVVVEILYAGKRIAVGVSDNPVVATEWVQAANRLIASKSETKSVTTQVAVPVESKAKKDDEKQSAFLEKEAQIAQE